MGHVATQMGTRPRATSSAHMSHLEETPSSSTKVGAPYGHTVEQVLQPMQVSWSMLTMPVASSFVMAPVGQLATQAGSSQWLHAMDTK